MDIQVPKDHPRYLSITVRESLIEATENKVVAPAGLIAHGRGEAFDYLIGEVSPPPAFEAIAAAAEMLLSASHPVLSVNGNAAALNAKELVELSEITGAPLEINLFYRSYEREKAIEKVLKDAGASGVLGIGDSASDRIPEVGSERRRIDPEGIGKADVVFVPLEDGDRTEGLIGMGKKVITVDLNPLSRTAQKANITIVDNLLRCMPLLVEEARKRAGQIHERTAASSEVSRSRTEDRKKETKNPSKDFDNRSNLQASLAFIAERMGKLSGNTSEESDG